MVRTPPQLMSTAVDVRASLDHPVIDGDGHWVEYLPVLKDAMLRIGGEDAYRGFAAYGRGLGRALQMSVEDKRDQHRAQEVFWGLPTKNTRDRATAMMPALLRDRQAELGFDFSILYPTMGLGLPIIDDDTSRRAACRAFNIFSAERFGEHADVMTPAAVIPMHTPEEAIVELTHAVNDLGLKVVMMASLMRRPVKRVTDAAPELGDQYAHRDVLGIDSPYDYDPVWQTCLDLGVSPTFHSRGLGIGLRRSPSNLVYNHIGHFAAAQEAVAKALFLGGVTRRFPDLKFAFLEGGVGWAAQLLVDLIEHWEIRNADALQEVNPDLLDVAGLAELAKEYGDDVMHAALASRVGSPSMPGMDQVGGIENIDDFAACEIQEAADVIGLYTDSYFFGCEADDRMNAWAFDSKHNPRGVTLQAFIGSDIGHFDVPDMAQVLPEAYEAVEDGRMTTADFRDFTFVNPTKLFTSTNPNFFDGTSVSSDTTAII